MSEGIGYALGAMLLYGVPDFVYKRGAAAGAEPHQFLMVQTWFFSSFAILYGFFSGALALNRGALSRAASATRMPSDERGFGLFHAGCTTPACSTARAG